MYSVVYQKTLNPTIISYFFHTRLLLMKMCALDNMENCVMFLKTLWFYTYATFCRKAFKFYL